MKMTERGAAAPSPLGRAPRRAPVRTLAAVGALVGGILGAGTVAAHAATPHAATAAPGAGVPFAVGISPGSDILFESPAKVASTMSAIAATGDRWIRIDVDWAAVEANRNSYNWSFEDTAIRDAVHAGLTVDAILDYAPSWALTNGQPDPTAFASFATRAVERYSAIGVNVYEVWNEENLGWTWNNAVNVTAYGHLLQSGYKAVHGADAHAEVLLGGLGRSPEGMDNTLAVDPYTFLSELYAGGYGRYFDAVAIHPYSVPDAPLTYDPADNLFPELPAFYSLMQSYGDGAKKIWITEFGYPTAGTGSVTETQQADYLATAIEAVMGQPWAGPFFVYNWQDDATQSYGLLHADGTPKPALSVFEEAPH